MMTTTIRAGLFEFTLVARETLKLPYYKGSTFRGAFGTVFKRVVCVTRKDNCLGCLLKGHCIYSYVFETPPPSESRIMRKYEAAPHPFVIEPPIEMITIYEKGMSIKFNLVLIGKALEYLPYFIYAFEEIGEVGLGKDRGKYFLKSVKLLNDDKSLIPTVYDSDSKTIDSFVSSSLEIIAPNTVSSGSESIALSFITPTRISYNNTLAMEIEFHILIRNLLRRLSLLSYFHCEGDILDWDFKQIIEMASRVKCIHRNLEWIDWERYSSRQDTKMKLGGFSGNIAFEGDIKPFMSLIKAGELLHIGKSTTFGLGKYVLD